MPVSSKFFVCAALCLAARGAQAARMCFRDYDSDDCSGDPSGDVFWKKDGACTDPGWIYICSEDLTSNILYAYGDSDCNGTSDGGTTYSTGCSGGSTSQMQWCSTTSDCSDPPQTVPGSTNVTFTGAPRVLKK